MDENMLPKITELVQHLQKESAIDEQNQQLCNELVKKMAHTQEFRSKSMELIMVLIRQAVASSSGNGILQSLIYERPCPSTSCDGVISLLIQPRISNSSIEYECPLKLSRTCKDGKTLSEGWRDHVRKYCCPKLVDCPGAPLCTQRADSVVETPRRRRSRTSSVSSLHSGTSSSAFSSVTPSSSSSMSSLSSSPSVSSVFSQ